MDEFKEISEIRIVVAQSFPSDVEEEINGLLKNGWKLLAIKEQGNKEEEIHVVYVLGRV